MARRPVLAALFAVMVSQAHGQSMLPDCRNHPWEKGLREGRSYSELYRHPLSKDLFAEVSLEHLPQALALLENSPYVVISEADAKRLGNRSFSSPAGSKLLLLRAMRYTDDGFFKLYSYGGEILVTFMDPEVGFMFNSKPTSVKAWAVIARVSEEPKATYALCFANPLALISAI
jgi:hypothetical protein